MLAKGTEIIMIAEKGIELILQILDHIDKNYFRRYPSESQSRSLLKLRSFYKLILIPMSSIKGGYLGLLHS